MFRNISEENFKDTGFCHTVSIISGKFKLCVLYTITEFKVVRFNELQRYIGNISVKTLSSVLKQLQADGLIERKDYHEMPMKVEYFLTERGKSLIPILDKLCEWGENLKKNGNLNYIIEIEFQFTILIQEKIFIRELC